MFVNPRKITHYLPVEAVFKQYGHPRRLFNKHIADNSIFKGKLPIMELDKIKYCFNHWANGVPWNKLDVEKADNSRYIELDRIFKQVEVERKMIEQQNNILVHINNDEIIFGCGGFHRFAIALILGLDSVPVDVCLIYKK